LTCVPMSPWREVTPVKSSQVSSSQVKSSHRRVGGWEGGRVGGWEGEVQGRRTAARAGSTSGRVGRGPARVDRKVGKVVGKDGEVDRKVVGTGGAERNACRAGGRRRQCEVQGRRTAARAGSTSGRVG
jgi:hypothetical protein